MEYKDFITTNLEKASIIANAYFGKAKGTEKGTDNNQVLTQADIEIGKLLVTAVQEKFPMHNIIDEEAGVINKSAEFTWVIDPIDGTSNFANGIPLYGIMTGLLRQGKPIAGGIALPFFKEIYVAEKGYGALCNDKQIFASTESKLLRVLISYCIDGHQENPELTYQETSILSEIVLNIRNLRSSGSAFDMLQVAKGGYGGYLNRTSKIWDNVAPHIIVEEAGAVYTDFFGDPMDYSNPLEKANNNFTVCAAPSLLHQQLQNIIHSKK